MRGWSRLSGLRVGRRALGEEVLYQLGPSSLFLQSTRGGSGDGWRGLCASHGSLSASLLPLRLHPLVA